MFKKGIIVYLGLIQILTVAGQAGIAFEPVPATGLPYIIVVESLEINGIEAPIQTQIGVFADTLCVGAAYFEGEESLAITCWQSDPSQELAGYGLSDSILFRLRIPFENDYVLREVSPQFIEGNGYFGWGSFTAVGLSLEDSTLLVLSDRPGYEMSWKVYPNPCKSLVYIDWEAIESGTIELIHPNGKVLLQQVIYPMTLSTIELNTESVAAGIYFLRFINSAGRQFGMHRIIKME